VRPPSDGETSDSDSGDRDKENDRWRRPRSAKSGASRKGSGSGRNSLCSSPNRHSFNNNYINNENSNINISGSSSSSNTGSNYSAYSANRSHHVFNQGNSSNALCRPLPDSGGEDEGLGSGSGSVHSQSPSNRNSISGGRRRPSRRPPVALSWGGSPSPILGTTSPSSNNPSPGSAFLSGLADVSGIDTSCRVDAANGSMDAEYEADECPEETENDSLAANTTPYAKGGGGVRELPSPSSHSAVTLSPFATSNSNSPANTTIGSSIQSKWANSTSPASTTNNSLSSKPRLRGGGPANITNTSTNKNTNTNTNTSTNANINTPGSHYSGGSRGAHTATTADFVVELAHKTKPRPISPSSPALTAGVGMRSPVQRSSSKGMRRGTTSCHNVSVARLIQSYSSHSAEDLLEVEHRATGC
jgi:hypothetical protein